MAEHRTPDTSISVAQTVRTSDGQEIGTVKETTPDAFKVDASLQPDYWLRLENATSDGEAVRSTFPKDSLPDFKLDGPLDMADSDAVSTDYVGNPSSAASKRPDRPS
jgi:hypothetical protein